MVEGGEGAKELSSENAVKQFEVDNRMKKANKNTRI